jgi:hypothetical protein
VEGRHSTTPTAFRERKSLDDDGGVSFLSKNLISINSNSPKYVHLINEQFYDHDHHHDKESAYDLSTSAANSLNLAHSVNHTRLCPEDAAKSRMHEAQERLSDMAGTSKKSHKDSPLLQHPFTNSSNLVAVMMDDKPHGHEPDEHSFYMSMRRHENGHSSVEYDEGGFRLILHGIGTDG